MKSSLYLFISLAIISVGFSADSDHRKLKIRASAAKTEFEEHGGERHKWKKGQAIPETLAEAGLLSDAGLV